MIPSKWLARVVACTRCDTGISHNEVINLSSSSEMQPSLETHPGEKGDSLVAFDPRTKISSPEVRGPASRRKSLWRALRAIRSVLFSKDGCCFSSRQLVVHQVSAPANSY